MSNREINKEGTDVLLTTQQIETWLTDYVSEIIGTDTRIESDMTFSKLGLDSSALVGLTGDLSHWLGVDFDVALPYDHPSISSLAVAVKVRLSTISTCESTSPVIALHGGTQ